MHPILARGAGSRSTSAVWALVGILLARCFGGPAASTGRSRSPSRCRSPLAYAFVCLSAWYVSRSMPLARDRRASA